MCVRSKSFIIEIWMMLKLIMILMILLTMIMMMTSGFWLLASGFGPSASSVGSSSGPQCSLVLEDSWYCRSPDQTRSMIKGQGAGGEYGIRWIL